MRRSALLMILVVSLEGGVVAADTAQDVVTLSIVGTTDLHGYVFPRDGEGGLAASRRLYAQSARRTRGGWRRRAAHRCGRHVSGRHRIELERRRDRRGRVREPWLCGRRHRQSRVRFRAGRYRRGASSARPRPARCDQSGRCTSPVSVSRGQPDRRGDRARRRVAECARVGARRGRRRQSRPHRRHDDLGTASDVGGECAGPPRVAAQRGGSNRGVEASSRRRASDHRRRSRRRCLLGFRGSRRFVVLRRFSGNFRACEKPSRLWTRPSPPGSWIGSATARASTRSSTH